MRLRWNGPATGAAPLIARIVAIVVALVLAGALVVWGIDLANRIRAMQGGQAGAAPERQIARLQGDLARLQLERDRLAGAAEKAAADTTQASRIMALERENGRLVEDLAALAAAPAPRGIAIRRAEAELAAPAQLSYRLLLTHAGPDGFSGQLELAVTVEQGGKTFVLAFPDAASAALPQYAVKLGQVQRLEGTLALPDGATVKSVQARVLEKGQLRSSLAVPLKDASQARS